MIAALIILFALWPWLPVAPCESIDDPLPVLESRLLLRFDWPNVPVLEIRYLLDPVLTPELILVVDDGLANRNCFLAGPFAPEANFIS